MWCEACEIISLEYFITTAAPTSACQCWRGPAAKQALVSGESQCAGEATSAYAFTDTLFLKKKTKKKKTDAHTHTHTPTQTNSTLQS